MNNIQFVTTSEVEEALQENTSTIVDVRSVDAYNGWRLRGEKRGGHLPGAKSLDVKWTNYMEWIEIVRNKKMNIDDNIIVYGYDITDSERVVECLQKYGYLSVSIYPDFLTEWVVNDDLPMENLERYMHLVPPQWVKSVIENERVEEAPNQKVVIVHSHYRNRDAYLSGHIPTAIDMDTLALESPETWNRRSPEELKSALEEHGITADTTVILYGKYMSPDNADEFPGSAAGDIGAMRNAFIMLYAGVKDVRILNGGFAAWQEAGYEVAYNDEPKRPVEDFGIEIPGNPDLAVDIPEAKQMIEADDADLVCVRSFNEYIGKVSGYNYIKKKGRIPGVIFGNCGSDAYHMENYRNLDLTIREASEVSSTWQDAGITPDKHLAFYCGTGWRGSEAFFNAWLMGYPRVSVFDGGWFEWSNDPENPVESGVPSHVNLLWS